MEKHLWEVDHPYYCNEGCYFVGRMDRDKCHLEYKSWQEFLSEWGEADEDYNLLFRWDWSEVDPESENSTYTGDDHYRNGTLKVFYFMQRKAYPCSTCTQVCRADEPAVREFLQKKFNHMKTLWEPFT